MTKRSLLLAAVAMLASGCGDAPFAPLADDPSAQMSQSVGLMSCPTDDPCYPGYPPIYVPGEPDPPPGPCDPWEDPYCQCEPGVERVGPVSVLSDGTEMTVSSCHGGGGGDGSEDPGGGGGEAALGFLADLDFTYDVVFGDTVPSCPPGDSLPDYQMARAHAWCSGVVLPTTLDSNPVLKTALERIAARGEECAALAEHGRELIRQGRFRVFSASHIPAGLPRMGGIGYENGIALLDSYYQLLDTTRGFEGYEVNLEFALAHELDHSLNDAGHEENPGHYPTYYVTTPLTRPCSGQAAP